MIRYPYLSSDRRAMLALVGFVVVGIALAMVIYIVGSPPNRPAHLAAPQTAAPLTPGGPQVSGTSTGPGPDSPGPAAAQPAPSKVGVMGPAGPAPVPAESATMAAPFVTLAETTAPPTVDLTSDGPVDWLHLGRTGADPSADDRKSAGSGAITDVASGTRYWFVAFPLGVSWHDGKPTVRLDGTGTGVYACAGSALTVTVDAGPGTHLLKVYGGVMQARGHLTAALSSGGPSATMTVENQATSTMVQFTATFRALPGIRLTLRWEVATSYGPGTGPACGNVALQAVSLAS